MIVHSWFKLSSVAQHSPGGRWSQMLVCRIPESKQTNCCGICHLSVGSVLPSAAATLSNSSCNQGIRPTLKSDYCWIKAFITKKGVQMELSFLTMSMWHFSPFVGFSIFQDFFLTAGVQKIAAVPVNILLNALEIKNPWIWPAGLLMMLLLLHTLWALWFPVGAALLYAMLMNTQLTIRSTFTMVKLSARAEVTVPKGVVLNSDVPDGASSALIGHR